MGFSKPALILAFLTVSFSCASMHNESEASGIADAGDGYCYTSDVKSFALPIYPDKADSLLFTYRIRVSTSGDVNKPIIIFLPGGPGYTSMDNQPKGIPTGYRYISTDQRGTGCNDLADSRLSLDSLTSKNMASDVVEAIKIMQLDNYIIYGHSFGTLHATKVVSRIEDEFRKGSGIHLPKALVLEGTLGKSFPPGGFVNSYEKQWENIKSKLPAGVAEQLSGESLPFSNQISSGNAASNWATYIRGMLYWGSFPVNNGFGDLRYSLLALDRANSNSDSYNRLGQRVANAVSPGYFPLALQTYCSELFESFEGETVLKEGKIISTGKNLCDGYSFNNPFDSLSYYISTPTIYFQGEADPASPLWQAQYHFKSHGAAARTFIQVEQVGHEPLQNALSPCKLQLWDSISDGGESLLQTLQQCPGVKAVTSENPEVNATELHVEWSWN